MAEAKAVIDWTVEEEARFRELYAKGSEERLLFSFPDMKREEMKKLARKLGIARIPFHKIKKHFGDELRNLDLAPLNTKKIVRRAVLKAKDLFSSGKTKDPLVLKKEPLIALVKEVANVLDYPEFVVTNSIAIIESEDIIKFPVHRPMTAALILNHVLEKHWNKNELVKISLLLGISPCSLKTKAQTLQEQLELTYSKTCGDFFLEMNSNNPHKIVGEVL